MQKQAIPAGSVPLTSSVGRISLMFDSLMTMLATIGDDGLIVNAVTDDSDSDDDVPLPYTGACLLMPVAPQR